MSGTNPVGTFAPTNVTSQAPAPYFPNNDGNWAVAARAVDQFAPHPASPAAMSVVIDAGFVDAVTPAGQQTITEVAQTTVTIGAAPSSPNNRIDLVVIDAGTGVASVVAGTPASSPSAPAIPAGKRQICQVSVPNGTTAIAASQITDLRAVWGHFARGIPFAVAGGTADALTGTFTPATPAESAALDGTIWRVRAAAANATTTPTWKPDAWTTARTIKKINGAALNAGDIGGANHELLLGYNYNGGSPFIALLNPAPAPFVGDSGSGGTAGAVPAPPSGSAAAGDFLNAGGAWSAPATVPSGVVVPFAGSSAPTGWLLCYGQSLSTSTYATLFAAIGYTYGGSGANFNLPDLRGRAAFGVDNMGGTAANRVTSGGSGITGTTEGASGGAETVTLTQAQMPSHSHSYTAASSNVAGVTGKGPNAAAPPTGQTTGATGSGGAHNNMPPAIMLNYIIKT